MTQEDVETLIYTLDDEGFDYALVSYSNWEEINDEEFQTLLRNYQIAHAEMVN